MKLACGRCIGCRLERSRQWAVRLVHEKRFHSDSAFITLTYADEHLPRDGSLDVKHFQDFMKRLRRRCGYTKLRFFHAGEYGEKKGRPHYHAIIFGHSFFEARVDVEVSGRGDTTWTSPLLSEVWPFGLNRVGEVSFESCAYVARYVCKKVTGPPAQAHYERFDERTGEVFRLKPEYCTMSRRPGIGSLHFERYSSEIYPADEVVSRGHRAKPPKFYDRMLEKCDPVAYAQLKEHREFALAVSPKKDRTPDRLEVREAVKLAQVGQLSRRYEIG
ncbi:VP4 [Kummerowia striata gokushovirus]|nr:VP4 [Kummerowia striata gokushovirus]